MSETALMWMEITFDILYLIVVWTLVTLMIRQRNRVAPEQRQIARLTYWAFALLALGDTGHVGFRVVAYALGGLDRTLNVLGVTVSLVGVGAFATAVTITFFYMLILEVWRIRFNQRYGPFEYALLGAGVVRLAIMLLPANAWSQVTPPEPMGIVRNLPLMAQGLGLAYLILRDSLQAHDQPFTVIGAMILVSYAFYAPVIFFVNQVPMLGMLMMPKTLAYVAIAIIAYRALYRQSPGMARPGMAS
jgi:hypothetical protein